MRFLRKNTAVIVTVGPFYDKTDGVTIEDGLTITNERITLTADTDEGSAPTLILDNITGATSGTDNDLNYITNEDAGYMQMELSAANTNRVGRMSLSITDADNHVPVFHEFFVLPAAIYDWLTGVIVPLPANMTQILGTAVPAPTVAGVPNVNVKTWNDLATVALPLTPTVAGTALDVSATGEAGIDWANIGSPTTAQALTGTTIKAAATTLAGTAAAGSATTITLTGGVATNSYYDGQLVVITGGKGIGQARTILSYVGATTVATVTRSWVTAPDDGTSVFVVIGSDVPAILEAGTATAGAAASITLDATASAISQTYKDAHIMITAGTGVGQTRLISDYNGSTLVATVTPAWATNPAAGSVYQIVPAARVDVGMWLGGTVATPNTTGVPKIDLTQVNGAAQTATLDTIKAETAAMVTTLGAAGAGLTAIPTVARVTLTDTVTTYTGNTKQTADVATLATTVGAAGAGLTAVPWNAAWDTEVQSEVADALEETIADSIPADGTRPSAKQALYPLTQFMLERSISSTTVTVKKADGATTLLTLTLNDATTPTSITRAT